MEVLVAGWVGSTNLGDELVLAGLTALLRAEGHGVTAVSVDPAATERTHGIPAVAPAQVLAAAGRADAVVLGGGGLLQDETSALNLPYHLSRVWAGRARRTPVVGLGLGAGRLTTRLGRALVRASLAGVPLTVRDAPSADLLAGLGLPRPTVAADLALALPPTTGEPRDRLVVCLRPWTGRSGGLLPASRRAAAAAPEPLPVVDERGTLRGVVSGSDLTCHEEASPSLVELVRHARTARVHAKKARGRTARELMTAPARTVPPDAGISDALALMGRAKVGRLVVVQDGRVVGMLTRSDVLRVFTRSDEQLAHEVEDRVRQALAGARGTVRVVVADGVVHLRGDVERASCACAAAAAAADVLGVVDLEDDVHAEVDDLTELAGVPGA